MGDLFGGLLASFELFLEAEGKSPKTLDNYGRAVRAFADHLHALDRVDDVTTVRADDGHPLDTRASSETYRLAWAFVSR
jgi:hypothetical protein